MPMRMDVHRTKRLAPAHGCPICIRTLVRVKVQIAVVLYSNIQYASDVIRGGVIKQEGSGPR